MRWPGLVQVLFSAWIEQDAPAVRAALERAEGVPELERMRMQVYGRLFQKDPESALRLLHQWGGRSLSTDSAMVRDWAARDPRHAAEVLRECGNSPAALNAGQEIGAAWGAEDPAAALLCAEERLSGPMRVSLARGVMQACAEKDPQAALAFLSTLSDAGFRGSLAGEVVSALAKTDPAGAMHWAENHLEGAAKRAVVVKLITGKYLTNPQAAWDHALALPRGVIKNDAVSWLAMVRMHKDGVPPAVDLVLTLTEPEARHTGFERLAQQLYSRGPREAAQVAAGPLAEQVPREFTEAAAAHYADSEPAAAMAWVETLPTDRQAGARASALAKWLQNSPQEAAGWLSNIPPGADRTRLVSSATQYICFQPVETAAVVISCLRRAELPAIRQKIEQLDISATDWRDAAWKAGIDQLLGN